MATTDSQQQVLLCAEAASSRPIRKTVAVEAVGLFLAIAMTPIIMRVSLPKDEDREQVSRVLMGRLIYF